MYKLINNFESVDFVNGIKFNSKISGENKIYNLRRHSQTIVREKTGKCPSRFNFLTNRIVNNWNQLTQETIEAKNLNSFKSKIDEWLLKRCSNRLLQPEGLCLFQAAVITTTTSKLKFFVNFFINKIARQNSAKLKKKTKKVIKGLLITYKIKKNTIKITFKYIKIYL